MGDFGDVAAALAAHDGVITTRQALSCGLSRAQIRGREVRGEWIRLSYGLFRSASHDFTEAAMVRAVVIAHNGVADGPTAAWWHGMIATLPVPLTISCVAKPAPIDWPVETRVSRRNLRPEWVTQVRGLRATAKPLTALIAAVELPEGTAFLDRMLQIGQVTLADLERAVDEASGMRGIVEARRLVKIAGSASESEAERLFVRLLREWGVTGWVQQLSCSRWRLDFAWPEHRVAVEISGWAFHRDSRRHGNDLAKANYLESIEWRELQYDWHMLNGDGSGCVQQVIELLNARGAVAL
ncbi:type IV toxin-antitoxin system AbiEi family antitoxin domain-containing protein [Gordonia sp. (in: high G+C Gram-positive bacteria)]|uniref:type IV toxin-antitoxin system AbiEi family antitoxin domain-containing protein n=1 Tax=Gordonia sp. (in: high G+C Gram-positive bacteria) TaxID=84139 RepID=UPI0016BCDCF1|nr:type IV toxin-antitoxin system AbiEi family antitoxin domain-containing protein [Gordonia sp. (in: high G+C Gram-positive bacteria)]